MTVADEKVHRFTRSEYHAMARTGMFEDKRVELLEGEVLDMSPQNEPHVSVVSALNRFLNNCLPENFQVRCQAPLGVGIESEPEPDFAVTERSAMGADHPETALLVIEVSDTTLGRDRRKASVYAAAGVQEYWIINIASRAIEQHTQPGANGYAKVLVRRDSDAIACQSLPLPAKAVRELLPNN
jgi:Uma2 family endonuclease